MKSLKILIVTGSLSYGGITSFLIPLVNQLAKQDYNVSLAYTYDEDSFVSRIDSSVRVFRHSRPTKKQLIFDYIKRLRLLDLLRIRFRNKRKTDAIAAIQRWGYRTAEITEVGGPIMMWPFLPPSSVPIKSWLKRSMLRKKLDGYIRISLR